MIRPAFEFSFAFLWFCFLDLSSFSSSDRQKRPVLSCSCLILVAVFYQLFSFAAIHYNAIYIETNQKCNDDNDFGERIVSIHIAECHFI